MSITKANTDVKKKVKRVKRVTRVTSLQRGERRKQRLACGEVKRA
jgi:hypothetical protein